MSESFSILTNFLLPRTLFFNLQSLLELKIAKSDNKNVGGEGEKNPNKIRVRESKKFN